MMPSIVCEPELRAMLKTLIIDVVLGVMLVGLFFCVMVLLIK